jgi:hypothetical protein
VQTVKMMYYPFVHPPRPVLWQALLYWDALTSISPEDGYQFGADLESLRDLELYQPTHADDLPFQAHAALVSDLRQVVEELPGEDLVPRLEPLGPYNRVYWGKLPYEVENDLVSIGALVPDADMLRASPVLLSQLMVVLAKHLAAATPGVIPFTDSPSAHQVAFTPLGADLAQRRGWQLQIGDFLPIPAPDTPLTKVLDFRQAYTGEREELAGAVRKLLLSVPDPASEADPAQAQEEIAKAVQQIKKAVQRLEKAGHSNGIIWLKRSLWVLGGLGTAAAGAYLLPLYGWLFTALSGLGIGAATAVTRPGVSTEYAYLQHLQSIFPGATWPSAAPTT